MRMPPEQQAASHLPQECRVSEDEHWPQPDPEPPEATGLVAREAWPRPPKWILLRAPVKPEEAMAESNSEPGQTP
jgi:hypothetical protein